MEKNVAFKLHKMLDSVIKCITFMKANTMSQCRFKKFCEINRADHVRRLLRTKVRWLSKQKCPKIFMVLFKSLSKSLNDNLKESHDFNLAKLSNIANSLAILANLTSQKIKQSSALT